METLARPDKSLAGYTNRCLLQESCTTCQSDADCVGEYLCVNIGGLSVLADFRCVAPCTEAKDCPDALENCQELINDSGTPAGASGCVPLACR